MKRMLFLPVLLFGFVFNLYGQHEYAPIKEQKIKYKDWTYKSVRTNEDVNLREYAKDKKLLLVFYFASWCHNSHYQEPFVQTLYKKYKDKGLGIIGVSLYSSVETVQKELDDKNITFPVVVETTSKLDREKSQHYEYRTKTGDNRKWGTPWNIFLTPSQMKEKGDVLVKKAFIVNGELIEEDAEKYIREQLGLPAEETKAEKIQVKKGDAIETCEEDKSADFVKPIQK